MLVAVALLNILLYSCKRNTAGSQILPPRLPATFQYELAWQDDFTDTKLNAAEWYHRASGVRLDGFNDTTTVSVDGNGNLLIKVYSEYD